MPIYEYICEKCGARIEVIQKVSDTPLKRCAKCRGKLGKTVSRTSFQLKGSGWYVTDYSRKDASLGKDASPGNDASAGKDTSAGKGAQAGTDKAEKVSDKKAETVLSTTASSDSD